MAGRDVIVSYRIFSELCNDSVRFREWLISNKLIPTERICYKCSSPMAFLGDRVGLGLFRCLGNHHPRGLMMQEPASNGTWFQESTFPSNIVLTLTFCFARKYVYETAASEAFKLKLPDKTIGDWYSLCRQVCMASLENPSDVKIGGPGVIVEVDEYKTGRLKYKRESFLQGSWILGMLSQDGSSRFAVYSDKDRNIETLINFLRKYVEPGSEIASNCWKFYDGLDHKEVVKLLLQNSYSFREPSLDDCLKEVGNNSLSGPSMDDGCKIESKWHTVKQVLLDKGVKRRDMAPYFCEYIWRRNAKSRGDVFRAFIKDISKLYPMS